MKRERLEDLGRLYEKLDLILDNEVFDLCFNEAVFVEHYRNEDNIRDLCDNLISLKAKLYQCYNIACGQED